MRVAVVSDTHQRKADSWLSRVYTSRLAEADALLHCGDMTGMSTFHFLNQHPALYAVAGNMDDWELAGELPSQRTVELNGFTVGMVHGWGERSSVPERAAGLFQGRVDIVCYGHTHRRDFSPRGGMVLVNPGSLSLFDGPSFAILTLKEGRKPECEFVEP